MKIHCVVFVIGSRIGIVGNSRVCMAVLPNHTMRTNTNCFIENLAVAKVVADCLLELHAAVVVRDFYVQDCTSFTGMNYFYFTTI